LIVVMEKFCLLLKRTPTTASAGSDRIMDIVTLVEAARAEQVLHNREEIIIIHAATLSARRVRTAMVPRDSVALFLDQSEIAVLVDNNAGEVSGWITMDDVMKVLMGQRV
jgi:CBS domain containing-hemolysin-like protein